MNGFTPGGLPLESRTPQSAGLHGQEDRHGCSRLVCRSMLKQDTKAKDFHRGIPFRYWGPLRTTTGGITLTRTTLGRSTIRADRVRPGGVGKVGVLEIPSG